MIGRISKFFAISGLFLILILGTVFVENQTLAQGASEKNDSSNTSTNKFDENVGVSQILQKISIFCQSSCDNYN